MSQSQRAVRVTCVPSDSFPLQRGRFFEGQVPKQRTGRIPEQKCGSTVSDTYSFPEGFGITVPSSLQSVVLRLPFGITGELVRRADSWAQPRPSDSKSLGVRPR